MCWCWMALQTSCASIKHSIPPSGSSRHRRSDTSAFGPPARPFRRQGSEPFGLKRETQQLNKSPVLERHGASLPPPYDVGTMAPEVVIKDGKPHLTDSEAPLAETDTQEEERETWSKKLDFLLSVIGFAVDLGNVWRFPYICYKNGGGAFLIPYLVMLIFGGLPLFYLELAMGQFQRTGCITVWSRICPMFKGIGYGICICAFYVAIYYNTIIAWSVFYLGSCFQAQVPWATCNNEWNTENCTSLAFPDKNSTVHSNFSQSSAEEFFRRRVLQIHLSTGINDIGGIRWPIMLCLMAVFLVVYFALWKGIKSVGKAVWVTATLPYIVLFILLIRGVTLPGAPDGILYYITPQWDKLQNRQVWADAASQVFFSLGPGFGVLLALSSYNKFHNNCYRDALITSSINCLTSFLAGFVVFSVLGYMAYKQGKDIKTVAEPGPGLVFIAYPEALATLDGAVFWSFIFFTMLIMLGLDTTFGGLEAIITAVHDEYPATLKRRELFVAVLIVFIFFGALPTTTYGGNYVIQLLDRHGAPISLLFIVFVEAVAVNWFYGVRRFSADIKTMLGAGPGIFWKICWAGISPIFLLILFIMSCVDYNPDEIDKSYQYPLWAIGMGWLVTCSSIICIPIYLIYKFIATKGSIAHRAHTIIQPEARPRMHDTEETPIRLSNMVEDGVQL